MNERTTRHAPALQRLPPRTQEGKDIRRAFASAVPDPVLQIDYTELELRILARILADLLQKR